MRNPRTDAGASDRLAGHVEDPTRIHESAQLQRPDLLGLLRCWEPPEKLHARRRLENAVILSAAKATGARSDRARQRYWAINEAANAYMTAQADTEQLCDVANALVREVLSASTFERIEGGE